MATVTTTVSPTAVGVVCAKIRRKIVLSPIKNLICENTGCLELKISQGIIGEANLELGKLPAKFEEIISMQVFFFSVKM